MASGLLPSPPPGRLAGGLFSAVCLLLAACAHIDGPDDAAAATAPLVQCDNRRLTGFDRLVILAPHPDDEVLGFAGLADAFLRQGKPVETVIVTDGDGYCDACTLWNTGSIDGPTCDARTLSNFETPEMDSFAEARRLESRKAARTLGQPAPAFLGFPDTSIGAAWANRRSGKHRERLHRSDFSMCENCDSCGEGYGGGPETALDSNSLSDALRGRLAGTDERTLIATTHWLDGHADHAALAQFVMEIADSLPGRRHVVFAVIHAHTAADTAFPDCWYPSPAALECPYYDQARADREPNWLAASRAYRLKPGWPQALPGDADYGEPVNLCLDPALHDGDGGSKLLAIEAFASQAGTVGRTIGLLPTAREGLLDCSGYLLSFVRSTEVFVLRAFD